MLMNLPRKLLTICLVTILGSAALLQLAGREAAAQSPPGLSSGFREDLLSEMGAPRTDSGQPRQQEAQTAGLVNLAYEEETDSVDQSITPVSWSAETQYCGDATCHSCQTAGCDSQSCTCGCDPCQCPPAPAPCIDCPHVSTLSPYFNVNIFGTLKLDMLFNTARPISPAVPFFLGPDPLRDLNENTVSLHARQTTLGAAFTGPQVGDFQSGGLVMAMFFNDAVIVDQYGFLPLQAYGELKNQDWRFAAGLQFDVFSPGLPTVLPFSALAATGNAGNSFRGQVRLERFFYPAEDEQWTLQFALSDPITTTIDPTFQVSEDNGWPNVEGRVALGLGLIEGAGLAARRPFEIGVSGVVGQIRTTPPPPDDRVVADVWGLSTDFRWKMNEVSGFAGELYTGRTLGTYNGGILQNINAETLEGVRSSGGWLEFFLYWNANLHSHVGYGIDDPRDSDIPDAPAAAGRVSNSVYFANLLWDLNQAFRVGFEFTWRETDYKTLLDNEGAGFHTQFQWAF